MHYLNTARFLTTASLLLLSLTTPTLASPLDDVQSLLANVNAAAESIDAALSPEATTLNTSDIIMAVVYQVGSSSSNLNNQTNLNSPNANANATGAYYPITNSTNSTNTLSIRQSYNSSSIYSSPYSNTTTASSNNSTLLPSTPTSSTTSSNFDKAYFEYSNALLTLAESALLRGRSPHSEPNLPVYRALNALAMAVHAYSVANSEAGLISTRSEIRSHTAGGRIASALGMWDGGWGEVVG
ncbi:hypothetical protein MBLNU230_g0865t1 [Neophaeotheca triangularis]